MTESVMHNSMIICLNATTPKSMAAWKGITASVAQIARQGPPVHRVRWVQGGRQVLKVFLESGVRLVHKALKESLVQLVLRVL